MTVIAINAGHWLGNPKGVPKNMPVLGGTLEWTLNSRVVDKVVELLKPYDVKVVQNYDVTGQTKVGNELNDRIAMAERARADIYLSIHHNGGINGGAGGGTTVYYYAGNEKNKRQATEMYDEIRSRTGLKGNRATPVKGTKDYTEVVKPTMDSYIIECAFMDSTTDVYYIADANWASHVAEGIVAFLVREFKLLRIVEEIVEEPNKTTVTIKFNGKEESFEVEGDKITLELK